MTSIFLLSLVKYFVKKLKSKQLFCLKVPSKGIKISEAGSEMALGRKGKKQLGEFALKSKCSLQFYLLCAILKEQLLLQNCTFSFKRDPLCCGSLLCFGCTRVLQVTVSLLWAGSPPASMCCGISGYLAEYFYFL